MFVLRVVVGLDDEVVDDDVFFDWLTIRNSQWDCWHLSCRAAWGCLLEGLIVELGGSDCSAWGS